MHHSYNDNLPERERQSQIDEARKLAAQDRHITPVNVNRSTSKLKGHEALLDALKANKTKCEFAFIDGEVIIGTIEHLDAMTVSVNDGVNKSPRVVFKTSLKYFTPINKA